MISISFFSYFNLSSKNSTLKRLDVSNGLSQNNVNVIYEDSFGIIWVGTNDGLNRFKGENIVTFNSNSNKECYLKSDYIVDIKQDNKFHLWLATSNVGLLYYDYKSNCFKTPEINYKENQKSKYK